MKTLVSFMWSRLLVNVGSIGCCSPDATGPEGVNAEGMYPLYIVGTLFLTSLSCQLTFWYLGVCLVVVFAACGVCVQILYNTLIVVVGLKDGCGWVALGRSPPRPPSLIQVTGPQQGRYVSWADPLTHPPVCKLCFPVLSVAHLRSGAPNLVCTPILITG